MERRSALFLGAAAALAACAPAPAPVPLGADGKPLPKVYPIKPGDESAISYRMLDGVNSLRQTKGAGPVAFNAQLIAACAAHSRDMEVQNQSWQFGSDRRSPQERVKRVDNAQQLMADPDEEPHQTELETLGDWSGQSDTRALLLDPRATDFGFAWFQETSGKLWWTALFGQAV